MNWTTEQWMLTIPAILGFIAIYALLPKAEKPVTSRNWGGRLLGLAALVSAGVFWIHPTGAAVQDVLFYIFAGSAIVSAVCMITNTNPVYAALWFALATLSTCGLFLMQSAPFLAAATIIVYAGAIVVTFLFVIMLARQAGSAEYDRHAREPFIATLTAFVLLGGLLYTIGEWMRGPATEVAATQQTTTEGADSTVNDPRYLAASSVTANPLSRPATGEIGTMRGLGRSLFGDYLYAVELAGTLLLVASIGAILIAPRRSRGNS